MQPQGLILRSEVGGPILDLVLDIILIQPFTRL